MTPLYIAIMRGHFDCMAALIEAGASVMVRTSSGGQHLSEPLAAGSTPLHAAAAYGSLAMVQTLLQVGDSCLCLNDNSFGPSSSWPFVILQSVGNSKHDIHACSWHICTVTWFPYQLSLYEMLAMPSSSTSLPNCTVSRPMLMRWAHGEEAMQLRQGRPGREIDV